jgi:hypothetical protein
MNKDNPARFDLHKVNLDSGKIDRVLVNPGPVIYWYFDHDFTLKVRLILLPVVMLFLLLVLQSLLLV